VLGVKMVDEKHGALASSSAQKGKDYLVKIKNKKPKNKNKNKNKNKKRNGCPQLSLVEGLELGKLLLGAMLGRDVGPLYGLDNRINLGS